MTIKNTNDFLKGQRDCKEGNPPERKPSEDYLRGYATQYQHEQNLEYVTREHR